jgi:hypothetical protein
VAKTLPPHFSLPIDPTARLKGLVLDKCKYLDSNATPLWLTFATVDDIGTAFRFHFISCISFFISFLYLTELLFVCFLSYLSYGSI